MRRERVAPATVAGLSILRPMATRAGSAGSWAVGRGMRRPILAYLAIVTLGVWTFYLVEDMTQGGDLVRAVVVATGSFLGSGLVLLAFLILVLMPAMVVTIELVHRLEASSRAARSVLGAASWAAGAYSWPSC